MSAAEPSGLVSLVTGAASGIGRATALRLAADGPVAVCDVNESGGEAVVQTIEAEGGEALFIALDVTDEPAWIEGVSQVHERYGRLDVLVNNAGIADWDPIEETTLETYMATVAVTQVGTFLGMKHCAELLKASGRGSIVNMSSVFGVSGGFGGVSPGYHSAKGAVRVLTKTAALGWAKDGVRVNSVHPGVIVTPLLDRIEDPDILTSITPLGRLGQPEEVAEAIAFLAGPRASFITGAELAIDGGFLAQ